MAASLLWFSMTLLAISSAAAISDEGSKRLQEYEETFGVEPHIFESQILKTFEKLKDFLKNGDPSNGVPPMDPLLVCHQHFDFIINDTTLKGSVTNVTFSRISDFEVENVELKLLPFHFKVEVLWQKSFIDGRYKVAGNIFNELAVNGTGKFTSETGNLSAYLYIRPTKIDSVFQIKDLILDFKVLSEKINFTNEYESGRLESLDEELALYVLSQVQEKYVPALVNTAKLVLNHFLLGYTFDQIWQTVMDLIHKK